MTAYLHAVSSLLQIGPVYSNLTLGLGPLPVLKEGHRGA